MELVGGTHGAGGAQSFTVAPTPIVFSLRNVETLATQGLRILDADGDGTDDALIVDRPTLGAGPALQALCACGGRQARFAGAHRSADEGNGQPAQRVADHGEDRVRAALRCRCLHPGRLPAGYGDELPLGRHASRQVGAQERGACRRQQLRSRHRIPLSERSHRQEVAQPAGFRRADREVVRDRIRHPADDGALVLHQRRVDARPASARTVDLQPSAGRDSRASSANSASGRKRRPKAAATSSTSRRSNASASSSPCSTAPEPTASIR